MLQLFGIARAAGEAAASEDVKIPRAKPLPGSRVLAGPTRDEAGDLGSSLRHTQGPLHGERGRESRAGPRGRRLCPLVGTAGTASQSQSKKPLSLTWRGLEAY